MELRRMREEDLMQVNAVFAKAFSEARAEEGLKRTRVSPCRFDFLRMYLERAGEGAAVAVEKRRVVGFSFSHMYGRTGWLGPVAVLPRRQGAGVGKALVAEGLEYLRRKGATVIGLETMPRNFRNIGFYLKLGLEVGPLCVDVVAPTAGLPVRPDRGRRAVFFSEADASTRERLLAGVGELAESLVPGLDYAGEVRLNEKHRFGDTVFLLEGEDVVGVAICHTEPYGAFEERSELKVTVLALRNDVRRLQREAVSPLAERRLRTLLFHLHKLAGREGLARVRLHPRTDKLAALRVLISLGYRIAYSDLRLWLEGYRETEPCWAVHFCRWQ